MPQASIRNNTPNKKGVGLGKSIFIIVLALSLYGCSEEINPLTGNKESPSSSKKEISQNQESSKASSEDENPIKISGEIEEKTVPDPNSNTEAKTAEIRREASSDDKIRTPGVWNLEAHLDDDKINRINQFRDPSLIKSYPELFGIGLDFEPLLSMEGKGPGRIRIVGTNIDPIEFNLGKNKEKIEIYPYYDTEFLFGDMEDSKEELEIVYIEGSKQELIDKLQTEWSNEREIYLEDKNLNDIVTLIDAERKGELKFKNLKDWLIAATSGLNKYNIRFEEITEGQDFKRIRTSTEMREDKKANAYDLCVWLANKAIEHGFDCELIILPNYCILGVSDLPRRENELKSSIQSYIDTRTLLDNKTITQGAFEETRNILLERISESIKIGQETINEQFKLGADNMIALKVEEWDKLYKEEEK